MWLHSSQDLRDTAYTTQNPSHAPPCMCLVIQTESYLRVCIQLVVTLKWHLNLFPLIVHLYRCLPRICLKMSYLFRTMNLYHAYGSNTSLNPTSKFGCTEISLQYSLNLSYKLPLPSVLHLSLHSPSLVLWHWARVRN